MSGARWPKIVFVAFVVIAAADAYHCYPLLPACMASHFDRAGNANNWQPKQAFFTFYAAVTMLALVIGFVTPRIIGVLPASMINLPQKDYWLAPERRAETMVFFETQFGWFGCALYFLAVCVFAEAMRANLRTPPRVSGAAMIFLLGAFVAFVISWSARLFLHFRRFSAPP
jgi:uncharacterized membrane protein